MDNILDSVKANIPIPIECKDFDNQLIMDINAVFLALRELEIGPKEGFFIEDDKQEWADFLEDDIRLASIKSYVGNKVKLMFDPPTNGSVREALERTVDELEWRISNV